MKVHLLLSSFVALATFSACVEEPTTGTLESALCVAGVTANFPAPPMAQYKPGYILPNSTSSQSWALMPHQWYYNGQNQLVVTQYVMFLGDLAQKRVLWAGTVSPQDHQSASSAMNLRLGGRSVLGRPPTPPPYPPLDQTVLASKWLSVLAGVEGATGATP